MTKLNATGTALVYSTYLGGRYHDEAGAISLDSAGNAYVTGSTVSPDFPTTRGAFPAGSGAEEYGSAFVTKLNAAGTALVYSTPGLTTPAWGDDIAVDSAGNAYVTGWANANFVPDSGRHPAGLGQQRRPFVTKLYR